MTICIAAIAKYNGEEAIVTATDQMITLTMAQAQNSNIQSFYEHTIEKYKTINNTTIAMLAGNPLLFNDLIKLPTATLSFPLIKEAIYNNFKNKRTELIQKQLLSIYNVDWRFILEMLKTQNSNVISTEMLRLVANYKLGTAILLVGFDGPNAMISAITEQGYSDYRDIGFHAIGSGDLQAHNTLLNQRPSREDTINKIIYIVYKAKRDGEVMAGVGKETDLLVLTRKGIKKLSEDEMNLLDEIYSEEIVHGKNHPKLSKIALEEI